MGAWLNLSVWDGLLANGKLHNRAYRKGRFPSPEKNSFPVRLSRLSVVECFCGTGKFNENNCHNGHSSWNRDCSSLGTRHLLLLHHLEVAVSKTIHWEISESHKLLTMNTLHNHVLIYDKDCPMCDLYTGAFIKTRMLDKNGRQDYCSRYPTAHPNLDKARSRDEIALINTQTGNIIYGIDSLFKILSNRFPALRWIFEWRLFRFGMSRLYAFVSYNRKVIAPAKTFEAPGSCTPSINLKYRWAYIIVSWVFTSTILSQYAAMMTPLVPATNFFREWMICGGQIVFQSVTVGLLRKDRLVHYLGNMMTVSNIGALLLIPGLWISSSNPWIHLIWFGLVVTFMLFEHNRRTKILELSVLASVSWVVYRLLILTVIYFL